MVVCVWVKNSFYSIIYVFTFILKLYCIYHFLCFPSVTYRSDIDECSSGSHDCHQNATCVNTAGHYDCICKPGLTGNGRNCSGEAIIFISFVKRHRGSPTPSPPPPLPLPQPPWSFQESLETRTRDIIFSKWRDSPSDLTMERPKALFFGKSGGEANASPAWTQDPCSTVVEGSQLFTTRLGRVTPAFRAANTNSANSVLHGIFDSCDRLFQRFGIRSNGSGYPFKKTCHLLERL